MNNYDYMEMYLLFNIIVTLRMLMFSQPRLWPQDGSPLPNARGQNWSAEGGGSWESWNLWTRTRERHSGGKESQITKVFLYVLVD